MWGSVNPPLLTDDAAAEALTNVIGGSSWKAIAIARGQLALRSGSSEDEVADIIRSHGRRRLVSGKLSGPAVTVKESKELTRQLGAQSFLATLEKRKRTGSAGRTTNPEIAERWLRTLNDEVRGD